ncbi:MAG: (Fe-S)-binding protein [Candidatus Thorarchaeota archaeon]|nr:(Fe-S)-binding protein [Candidatus Thorarchaeota archaeon]
MDFPALRKYGLEEFPYICAQCSYCQIGHGACPTYKVKRVDSYSGRGKMLLARGLIQGRISPTDGLEGLKDAIFGCTLCGGCEEICQTDIPFVKIYQVLRGEFMKRGMWPESMNTAKETLLKTCNIQGQSQMDRIEGWSYWTPNEDDLLNRQGKSAETAFFFGCSSSYRGVSIQATIATTLIMDNIGEDYTVLGEEEYCCGAPLIMTGDFEGARTLAEHNIERYKELGVKRIITNCPGCFKMWAHEYKEFLNIDHGFEVVYGYSYIKELIDQDKIKFTKPLNIKLTYHDGCDAGRNSGFYDEPRDIIAALPGVEFEELPHNKDNCYCCGSGGVLRAFDHEFAADIGKLKAQDIERTQADVVASGCPSCVEYMKDQLPQAGCNKTVKDLAVLVAEAMGLTWDGLEEIYE